MSLGLEQVYNVVRDWSERPFSYGNDCCQFVASILEKVYGSNPMDRFQYVNEKQAYRIINSLGGLVAATTDTLGPPIPNSEPFKDLDIVACKLPDETWIMGVVLGGRIAVKTETGIADWPTSRVIYRWRYQQCLKR